MRRKRWTEAREMLESLDNRFPRRPEVLTDLVNVNVELKDMRSCLKYCERLAAIVPNDPDITMSLAGAYIANLYPALGLRTFRRFLDRWPDHERADEARKTVALIESGADEMMEDIGLAGEDGFELAAMHEEVQCLMTQRRYVESRKLAEALLDSRPDFAPALNNMSLSFFIEGDSDQAIASAERVLAFAPDNFQALSNLTRYLCLSGRLEEAEEMAGRLKQIEAHTNPVCLKKAEALTYLGDDQGVLDVFEEAQAAGLIEAPLLDPLFYHLTAVAAMRLGQEEKARACWREALDLSPGFELVQENLADLRNPEGARHAPWPYNFAQWVPQKTVEDMGAHLRSVSRRGGAEASTQLVERFIRQHPEIAALIPLLLERGDPAGRHFAFIIASSAGTPEMQAALKEFALSRWGPDEMRHKAAQVASEAGLLPPGSVKMWMQGEWREVMLLGIEVHGELSGTHRPQVTRLLARAMSALKHGDGKDAEALLKEALAIEPDAPDLLHNLSGAYEVQGRIDEAEALTRENHKRNPDYLFARTALARLALREGNIEEAEELLKPLLLRRRLHFAELTALCAAQVEFFVAKGELDAARAWMRIWEDCNPDDPSIADFRQRLERPGSRFFR
ncbi:MAG: tetratricopeptide repeat protein [Blastocatellia bacterium]|nr:tetratricopeptide repeat protein [Blastocatellia bacterium]